MEVVKYMAYGLVIGVPIAVTVCEKIGCFAKVSGPSMRGFLFALFHKPTLNPANVSYPFKCRQEDVVWVNRSGLRKSLQPGDVVAFNSPVDPADMMVKRVIAVGKEILVTNSYRQRQVVVPEGHLWLEGDNVKRSKDSNFFGPVSEALVVGVVSYIVWPPHRMKTLEHKLSTEQYKRKIIHYESDFLFEEE